MSNVLSRCLITVVFLCLNPPAWAELPPLTHGMKTIDPVVPAPPLRLHDMDEEWVDLHDLRGKVVVVNFWATWCPPCRREMPSLERLYQAIGRDRLVVLAVNIGEDLDTVFSFLGQLEPSPSFPILFDTDAATLASWPVKGLPTTFVVDPLGKLRFRAVGGREFDHPDLIEQLRRLAETPAE